MRQAGNVVRADVFVDETGRSKGCGIVEYSTPEEAQNAIKTLNDTKLDETERLIFVREDREERTFVSGPRRPPVRGRGAFGGYPGAGAVGRGGGGTFAPPPIPSTRGRQVFVGNLPYTTSWQDLKDQFRLAGNVIRADILLDTTGRSKGQGTVLFESPQDAQKAIRMFENTDFQTRIISVHEDKFAQWCAVTTRTNFNGKGASTKTVHFFIRVAPGQWKKVQLGINLIFWPLTN